MNKIFTAHFIASTTSLLSWSHVSYILNVCHKYLYMERTVTVTVITVKNGLQSKFNRMLAKLISPKIMKMSALYSVLMEVDCW